MRGVSRCRRAERVAAAARFAITELVTVARGMCLAGGVLADRARFWFRELC